MSDAGHSGGSGTPAYLIRYPFSFETAVEAGRFFQARQIRLYYTLLIAGLLVGGSLMLFLPGTWTVGLWIALTCAALLLMAQFNVMDRLVGRRRVRSLIGGTVELTFNEDGIAWAGPQWSGSAPWTSVTEVRTNTRTVLFVADRILLCFAPADAFASADEQADVVEYSRRQIGLAAATGRHRTA